MRALYPAINKALALGLVAGYLGSGTGAQAAPAKTPTRARATQNTYFNVYPSLNRLAFTQSGAIPLDFSSTSITAGALRAGYVFGLWAVEGNASLASYNVRALIDRQGEEQRFVSRRFSFDLMRRLFANQGKLRLSGNLRVGVQSQTIPLIYAQEGFPFMGRLNSTNLGVAFALSSYLTGRTRLSFTAKWLPPLKIAGGPAGSEGLQGGFSYELTLGAQHLLNQNWSVGLFANLQGSRVSGTMLDVDEELKPFQASNTEVALQFLAGYQF